MKNLYILAIGSNSQTDKNISLVLEKLKSLFEISRQTHFIQTTPVGINNAAMFTNGLVEIKTELLPEDLKAELKKIEKEMGRTPDVNKSIIPVDIDIIMYNNTIVHKDTERDYIKHLMNELTNSL